MRFGFTWAGAAVVVALALLPMKTGGCGGKTVCLAPSKGVCPSAQAAMTFFSSGCGDGQIQSVDGEASFDGQLCCYAVTEFSRSGFEIPGCFEEPGGFGGVGGTGGLGGFGGVGGFGGFGGEGGGCFACADQFAGSPVSIDLLCPPAAERWNLLLDCGCNQCGTECGATICMDGAIDETCFSCLDTLCPGEVTDCSSN